MRSARRPSAGSRASRGASRRALVVGMLALLACAALGTGIRLLAGNTALPVDLAWQDFSSGIRSPAVDAVSVFLNDYGSRTWLSFLLPLAAAALLAWRRRPWGAVAVLVCGLACAPLVDGLKSVLQRPRPEDGLIQVSLSAYPSGHVANLTVLVVIAALLTASTWVWVVGGALVLAMAFSRTYLGVHWLTDDLGGVLLGSGIALVVWGLLAGRLATERRSGRAR